MNRNPIVGDVITVKGSDKEWLVVYGKQHKDQDTLRGDSYFAYVFRVIDIEDVDYANPKTKTYTVKENSSMVEGKLISLSDITLHDFVKVEEIHAVVYSIGSKRGKFK